MKLNHRVFLSPEFLRLVRLGAFPFLALALAACTSSSSAPTPPSIASGEKIEDAAGNEPEDTELGTEDELDTEDEATPEASGASVGSEEMQEAVSECNAEGRFYDRYANDGEGECSKGKLAKTACTIDNIKSILSGKVRDDFETAAEDTYSDFEIDQCLDCPPGNSLSLCRSESGTRQTGTKIYFVKEGADSLEGASRVVSKRPDADSEDEEDEE